MATIDGELQENDAVVITVDPTDGRILFAHLVQKSNVDKIPLPPGAQRIMANKMPTQGEGLVDMTHIKGRPQGQLDIKYKRDPNSRQPPNPSTFRSEVLHVRFQPTPQNDPDRKPPN